MNLTPHQTIALEEEGRAIALTLKNLLPSSVVIKQVVDEDCLNWQVYWGGHHAGGFSYVEGWIRTIPHRSKAPDKVRSEVKEAINITLRSHQIAKQYQNFRNPLTAA